MIKTKLLLTIILCIGTCRGLAQVINPGEVHTENAGTSSVQGMNTGGSDLYSVDLYSGTANVNIPIYNFSLDGLNLGISLGYNTKGIKVDQTASTVGLGWDVAAGASITRQVNGIEDEVTLPALGPNDPYNVNHPIVPSLRGAWCEYDHNYPVGPINTADSISEDSKDIWQINLFGQTVKWVYNPSGAVYGWKIQTDRNMVIDIYYNGQIMQALPTYQDRIPSYGAGAIGPVENGSYLSFVVTDGQNNKFYFEPGEHEKKLYQDDRTNQTAYYYPVTKWVLTKIVTFSNQQIDYTYNYYGNVSYPASKFQSVREGNAYSCGYYDPYLPGNATKSVSGVIDVQDSVINWQGTVCAINEIKYPNGVKAKFNYDNVQRCDLPGQYALANVQISSEYDNKVKNSLTYQFNYAYFNTPTVSNNYSELAYNTGCSNIPSTYLRLKLKSIDKLGTDLNFTERYYTFDYNTTSLPERTSYMQDCYGYYNNESTTPLTINTNTYYLGIPYHSSTVRLFDGAPPLIPDVDVTVTYGMSKAPNFAYASANVLTEVKNGLGGKFNLFYKDGSSMVSNTLVNQTYHFSDFNGDPNATSAGIDPDLQYSTAYDGICIDKIVSYDGFNTDHNTTTQYDFYDGERFFMGGYFWLQSLGEDVERTHRNTMVTPQNYPNGSNHGFLRAIVTTNGYGNEELNKRQYWFSGKQNLLRPTEYNVRIVSGVYYHQQPEQWLYTGFLGLNTQFIDYDKAGNPIYKRENKYGWPNGVDNLALLGHTKSAIQNSFADIKFPVVSSPTDGYAHAHSSLGTSFLTLDTIQLKYAINTTYSNYTEYKDSVFYSYDNYGYRKSAGSRDSKWAYWEKNWNYVNDYGLHLNNTALKKDNNVIDAEGNDKEAVAFYRVRQVNKDFDAINKTLKHYHYDNKNNVIESIRNHYQDTVSYVWDTRIGQKTAQVVNAAYKDIAYTSFEGGSANFNSNLAALDYDKGNWIFDPANIACYIDQNSNPVTDKPITGSYYFSLPASNEFKTYKNLTDDKKYFLSFWTTSSSGNIFSFSGFDNTVTLFQQAHVGVWYLYTATVVGSGGQGHITNGSGNAVKIDELRLHPVEAGMDTYTYQPLFGVSSHCDERNNITYYEYNAQGQLKVVRDIDGKVLSLNKYVIQGTDN